MAPSTEIPPFGFSDIPLDSFSLGFWRDRIEGHIRNPRAHGFEDTSLRIDRYTLKLTCNAECWRLPFSFHPVLREAWKYIPIGASLTLGKTEAAVDFTGKAEKNGGRFEWALNAGSLEPVWEEDGSLNPDAALVTGGEVTVTVIAPPERISFLTMSNLLFQLFANYETTVGERGLKADRAVLSLFDLRRKVYILKEADLTREVNSRYLDEPHYDLNTLFFGGRFLLTFFPIVQPYVEAAGVRLETILHLDYTEEGKKVVAGFVPEELDTNGIRAGRVPLEEWGGALATGARLSITQLMEEFFGVPIPFHVWIEGDGSFFWIPDHEKGGDRQEILIHRFRGALTLGI